MFPGGRFGLVIRWDDIRKEIGIQQPGADDIKWIHASEVTEYGDGALVVTGPSGLTTPSMRTDLRNLYSGTSFAWRGIPED